MNPAAYETQTARTTLRAQARTLAFLAAAILAAALTGCGDDTGAQGTDCEDANECVPVDCDGQAKQLCFRGKCETNPSLVCK